MQRHVMEDAMDAGLLHGLDEGGAILQVAQQQVIEMGIVPAALRHHWPAHPAGLLQGREGLVIAPPQRQPPGGDSVCLFHLRPQEGGDDLPWKIRGADIHPGVLVHLTPEELTAVGTLFADDLVARGQGRVVDQEGATLAGDDVLGLVKAQGAEL